MLLSKCILLFLLGRELHVQFWDTILLVLLHFNVAFENQSYQFCFERAHSADCDNTPSFMEQRQEKAKINDRYVWI